MQNVNFRNPLPLKEFQITADEANKFQKQIFIDTSTHKMYYEAKRALDRVGIQVEDLIERPLEEFQFAAKRER